MKKLFVLLSIVILFFSCTENNTSEPEENLGKKKPADVQSFQPMQDFEFLRSTTTVSGNNLEVQITDEFYFVRSRHFFVEITYEGYSQLIYLNETIDMNFTLENYGTQFFQYLKVYAIQGD
ncbi:MAG: hypothetical protein ACP5N7_04755 [Candidatus Pacearchaeota archaeon]